MTLCVAAVQQDVGYLISDAAWFGADGVVRAIGSKVAIVPGICAAISFEGVAHPADMVEQLQRWGVTTQRELVRRLGDLAVELMKWTLHWHPDEPQPEVMLAAVVYDPQVGATAWLASSGGALQRPGLLPGQPRLTQAYFNFGDPSDALGRKVEMPDATSFDVERDGLLLAEAARRGPWDEGVLHPRVGGFVELTSVGPQGLTRQVLATYADAVGQPINLPQ